MTFFKRALGAAAVTAMLASSAIAADAPLPAGKAAGTKQATLIGTPFLLIGLAVAAVVVAISVSSDNNKVTGSVSSGTNF